MAIPKGPVKAGKSNKAKAIKEGQIKKKGKEASFKQTPQGKVSLIHNKKNGNSNPQKNISNQSSQQQSKKKQLNFANKQKDNKKSLKSPSPNQKQSQKKKNKGFKDEEEKEDSDEDINEGISMTDSMMEEDDDDDADTSHDESVPNVFGESLAEDTDEDDDDFDADSDDEEEKPDEKKGVKMFKGVKSDKQQKIKEGVDDDDDDEDEDDEEEEDNDDDEDEDEEDEDFDVSANASKIKKESEEEDDDDDDDDDEDDAEADDDDDDEDGPGLKALIGQSLVDDDDDEDFEGEEDDDDDDDDEIDESDEDENNSLNNSMQSNNSSTMSSPSKDEKIMLSPEAKAEQDKRSIYIGNIPKDIKESRVRSEFGKFGPIESLRVRGVIPESPSITYKVAAIKKKLHPKSTTVCIFIVYKSEESAIKALEMNGKQFEGHYLRVDRVNQQKDIDPKKAVYIGNLPYDTEDNELWEIFKKCGEIDYVRTIRDRQTGVCRGSGYVNFKTEDAATLAIDLNGTKLKKREIRVQRYEMNKKPKYPAGGQKRSHEQNRHSASKKPKIENKFMSDDNGSPMKPKMKKEKRSQGFNQRSNKKDDSFQGQAAHAKNKGKKGNKFDQKKKAMAGKLLSKPKKPQ